MTLTFATLLAAGLLVSLGLYSCTKLNFFSPKLLRNNFWQVTIALLALGWVLYKIIHLSEADFGQYKNILFVSFLTLGLLSLRSMPDLLLVRSLMVLLFALSGTLLEAAFMQPATSRLWLVSLCYLWIIGALIFTAMPYLFKNLMTWLSLSSFRQKILATLCFSYSFILIICAFTY